MLVSTLSEHQREEKVKKVSHSGPRLNLCHLVKDSGSTSFSPPFTHFADTNQLERQCPMILGGKNQTNHAPSVLMSRALLIVIKASRT